MTLQKRRHYSCSGIWKKLCPGGAFVKLFVLVVALVLLPIQKHFLFDGGSLFFVDSCTAFKTFLVSRWDRLFCIDSLDRLDWSLCIWLSLRRFGRVFFLVFHLYICFEEHKISLLARLPPDQQFQYQNNAKSFSKSFAELGHGCKCTTAWEVSKLFLTVICFLADHPVLN